MSLGSAAAVQGLRDLRGTIRVPGDKSISLRAILLAALANGRSMIRGVDRGHDSVSMTRAVAMLGAKVDYSVSGLYIVGGPFQSPSAPLDTAESETSLRLLAGGVAGLGFPVTLTCSTSLRQRHLDAVLAPLRLMGAMISVERTGGVTLTVRGRQLHGLEYHSPVVSAQVKSAALIAGLRATSAVTYHELMPTRDHTEEILTRFGADVRIDKLSTRVSPGVLRGCDITVPGDPSHAAYWLVASAIVPDSDIEVRQVYLGPRRTGYLDALTRMGAQVDRDHEAGSVRVVYSGRLRAAFFDTPDIPSILDEIPILAVAAATADGTTIFRGVSQRRREDNRLVATADMLRAFGIEATATQDELVVHGREQLLATSVRCAPDHHVTMSAAIAALTCDGESTISDWSCATAAYPEFFHHLRLLHGV